jgi:hypothetical protein
MCDGWLMTMMMEGGESAAMIRERIVGLMSHTHTVHPPLVLITPNSKSVPKVRYILPARTATARRREHTEKNFKKPEKDFKKFSFGGVW